MNETETKSRFDQMLREVSGLLDTPGHRFDPASRESWVRELKESAAICRGKGWSVAERTFEHKAEQVLRSGDDGTQPSSI